MKEIERRIRAARPLSGNRNLPLSDRAKRELAELIMDESGVQPTPEPSRARSRFRLSRPTLASIAAGVAAVSIIAVWSLTPAPVHAASPRLLEFEPVTGTAPELLLDLAAHTCDTPWQTTEPDGSTVIVSHNWWFRLEQNEDLTWNAPVIQPQITTTTITPAGRIEQVAIAGEPFADEGIAVDNSEVPGTELYRSSFDLIELGEFYLHPLPETVEGMGDVLAEAAGVVTIESGAEAFRGVEELISYRIPSCRELALVLEFVATMPDVEIAGRTVDRVGRDVVAVVGERESGPGYRFREFLLLDPETGYPRAVESEFIGTDTTHFNSPSVVSYNAWVVPEL
ncbi:hypothetical protein SAMN06298212_1483 [Ruaniaceae bacterium KH17]|nr:hypothetical protein SAMN06298212_1483 [Ruaniaceae bacterium KH17]